MKPDSTVSRYLPQRRNLGRALGDFALLAIVGLVIALGCYIGLVHIHA